MSRGRGNAGKGARSMKNKSYYERQFAVTERNKARKAAATPAFAMIASAVSNAKRALRARVKDGTVGESRFNAPAKVGTGHGRADISVTIKSDGLSLWRLPIDTTDQHHVQQGVGLVKAALRA